MPNEIATELNEIIRGQNPYVSRMLSVLGTELYFPKGILSQSAEAREKATFCNATIGIARGGGEAMHLPCVMEQFRGFAADDVLPYAPATGKPELRAKWADAMLRKNPTLCGKPISTPVVTSGITHGLSLLADMFVDPGDVVLLPRKLWGNYKMIFGVRHGADIRHYPFFSEAGGFDTGGFAQALREHAGSGKLVVLLNFPNNPTGYSLTVQEARKVCEILTELAESGCNVVAVCDDAYFGLFYEEDVLKESLFAHLAGSHERLLAVKLDGATKEDYVWGLRVGFMTFSTSAPSERLYEALESKTGGAIRGNISNCSHLSQAVLLRAMQNERYEKEKEERFAVMRARAARVKGVLSQSKFSAVWTPYPFNSGYFMCLRLRDTNAEQFRLRLLEEYGTGVIATGKKDIRVAFSCIEEQDMPEFFETMFTCARDMKPT